MVGYSLPREAVGGEHRDLTALAVVDTIALPQLTHPLGSDVVEQVVV
jgi:hypothetical protein